MIWARRHVMRLIGRYMKPIPPEVAKMYHDRLTFAYIFLSFNAFMLSYYIYDKHQASGKIASGKPEDKAHDLAKRYGFTNPTIYRFGPKGVQVEQYTVPHEYDNIN